MTRPLDIAVSAYRLIEKLWRATRRLLDPVARLIGEPIARLIHRGDQRRDAEDLALADQLEAAGLARTAAGLRHRIVERQSLRAWP